MNQCLVKSSSRIRENILGKELWTEGQHRGSAGHHARFMKPLFKCLNFNAQREEAERNGPQIEKAMCFYVSPCFDRILSFR